MNPYIEDALKIWNSGQPAWLPVKSYEQLESGQKDEVLELALKNYWVRAKVVAR